MDIVIYTNPETLLHKTTPNLYCWWDMKRVPKDFEVGDRIYFVVKKEVRGYFVSNYFDPACTEHAIEWDSDTWTPIDGVHEWMFCEPFRGFRYRWWDLQEED